MKINHQLIGKVLSAVFAVTGASMLLPAVTGYIYGEYNVANVYMAFAVILVILGLLGINLIPRSSVSSLKIRDGFLVVAESWLSISVIGAVPFIISGDIPRFADAFFETASGFSTTGSTILTNVEALSKAGLMWRSFTHWLGGMGLLVLTIALLPKLGIGGQRLMRAESTGITVDKGMSFTTSASARSLYKTYISVTIAEFIILIFAGLSPYDSMIHTFGTVGTGGFSSYNASIAAFNSVKVEMIIAFFMLICGINFGNVGLLITGHFKKAFHDTELRTYLGIIASATVFIAVMLTVKGYYGAGQSLRYSFFQVVSIITTTGYGTADFDTWPEVCRMVILVLMFIGGCAGSTGGGTKVIRSMLLMKLIKRGAVRKLHPNNVIQMRLNGSNIKDEVCIDTCGFFALFGILLIIGTFIMCFETDIVTAFTSVLSSLSNIGPGLNKVGPSCNWSFYSDFAKIFHGLLMIAGRLELYTVFLALRIVE